MSDLATARAEYDRVFHIDGPKATPREMVAGAYVEALEAEVERLKEYRDVLEAEVLARSARIPDPDDLLLLLDGLPENPDPGLVALWWASYDRLRATLEEA